jgi:DNA invertase Pin-like site-specific DNA recombinase
MGPVVSYNRVSTGKQGQSGLGMEAQREAISRFDTAEGLEVLAEFVEVESGKGSDALDRRPRLTEALAKERRAKALVVVAKLCRFSRDLAFISGLMHNLYRSSSPSWARMPTHSCCTYMRPLPRKSER